MTRLRDRELHRSTGSAERSRLGNRSPTIRNEPLISPLSRGPGREREVLVLLTERLTDPGIAAQLVIMLHLSWQ